MSRYAGAVMVATALMLGTVVWAASRSNEGGGTLGAECVTAEQVRAAVDRSRNGVSLTCNDDIRRRNLERMGAQ